ncbi:MAG TPA: hypothetical protein VFW40_12250, partial [Capsulimonadaceae bacterium]|nr:hypothetical protein [Capsulimonadaceae bacterium]
LRHISCTSTVVADPEQTEAARALLTHSDKRVTEERYVIASSLAASRQQAELIAKMRKRFVFPI